MPDMNGQGQPFAFDHRAFEFDELRVEVVGEPVEHVRASHRRRFPEGQAVPFDFQAMISGVRDGPDADPLAKVGDRSPADDRHMTPWRCMRGGDHGSGLGVQHAQPVVPLERNESPVKVDAEQNPITGEKHLRDGPGVLSQKHSGRRFIWWHGSNVRSR